MTFPIPTSQVASLTQVLASKKSEQQQQHKQQHQQQPQQQLASMKMMLSWRVETSQNVSAQIVGLSQDDLLDGGINTAQ